MVPYSQVQGKYIFTFPLIGNIVSFITTSEGFLVTLTFIVGIYILYEVAIREYIRKKSKKMVRYKAFGKEG